MRARFYDPTLEDEDISIIEIVEKQDISLEYARQISEEIVGVCSMLYNTKTIGSLMREIDTLITKLEYPLDDSLLL